ncbi:U3 snoRNP protein, partial [Dispira parvispora]
MQALSIMAHLHTMPLPTMQATMELLVERIFQLLRTAGNTQSTLVQTCFALLASLIHEHRQTVKVKPSQVAFLLSLIQPDLDEFENHGTNFKLLRSIIERKVHAPEIFDVLDRISEKMVIHPTAHVRDKCRRIYFQFLVHYPLTQKRLAQNMNFLVKNLSFNFESGRESVLEMMNTIVNKFSDELLANFVELFFVGLASLLVNDESKQCREMAATLMQRLFSRMNNDHLTNVTVLLDTWFTDGLDVVCRVAYDHHLDNRLSELVNFEVPERGQLQPTGELVEDVFEAIGGQVHRRVPLYRTEIPKLRLQRTSMQIYGLLVEALGSECRPHSSNLSGQ